MAGRGSVRPSLAGGLLQAAEELDLEALLRRAGVDVQQGLSWSEARRRLARDGPNELPPPPRHTLLQLALEQVRSTMVLALMGATTLSFALGEWLDGWAILAIVLLNVVLGVVQEFRAEKAMEAIARMGAPRARVRREGAVAVVPAGQLVVGDVILLEAGDRVPADARLVEAFSLQVEESALTGESEPAAKEVRNHPAPAAPGLLERPHMVWMGTTVTAGRGVAVVARTGSCTELGTIARMVGERPSGATPLQASLEHLGRWLVGISAAAVAVVFLVGVLHGQPWLSMLLVAVGLAVAAIPEGLPAAVTAALALGVQRLSRRRAIVRRLSAVETLGCSTVICSDKTGTLTCNEMTVSRLWAPWGQVEVEGHGFAPTGHLRADGQNLPAPPPAPWRELVRALALASRADVEKTPEGRWVATGDPTDAALACLARKAGIDPAELQRGLNLCAEAPFEPQRRMTSVAWRHAGEGRARVYAKGAPDAVLARCRWVRGGAGAGVVYLTPALRRQVLEQADRMASEGLRVLALAEGEVDVGSLPPPSIPVAEAARALEREMVLVALVGLYDPPRPEVAAAVARARQAGVRTLMVTGDHPQTALAVARAIGLAGPGERAVLGAEMARLTDAELQELAARHSVFARVAPAEKRRLVRVLKEMGHVVAMTGDGVNDAPALREADIGVAMGISGTDVARRAASMVLADDNYATIVGAIEEGRAIYENIRRFIRYLMGCNVGEVLLMLGAGLLGLPVPLSALQLLWVNLVTDGLPALALGMLPASPRLMRRPPRPRSESLFARGTAEEVAEQGLVIGASTLLLFGLAVGSGLPLANARTAAFAALVASQMVYAVVCAAQAGLPPGQLRPVWAAVVLSWGLQLAVLGLDPLQQIFQTVWPSPREWAAIAAASVGVALLRAAADGLVAAAWRAVRRRGKLGAAGPAW